MTGSAEPAPLGRLRDAARADGLELRDDAMSLAELDGLLSAWRGDGADRPWLADGVAAYLALVLTTDVAGARPGPDDTVVLADGAVVDARELALERLTRPNADLRGVVREVHARPVRRRRWWRPGR